MLLWYLRGCLGWWQAGPVRNYRGSRFKRTSFSDTQGAAGLPVVSVLCCAEQAGSVCM